MFAEIAIQRMGGMSLSLQDCMLRMMALLCVYSFKRPAGYHDP